MDEDYEVLQQKASLTSTGLVFSFLGLLAVIFPFFTGISLSVLFGITLIISSFSAISTVFSSSKLTLTASVGYILLSIIYLIAGISMITNPVLGLTTFTIILLAYLVITGILEVALGIAVKEYRSLWPVLSGVLSLVLAYLIFVRWPSTAATVLGIFFGLGLISTGISLIIIDREQ